MVRRLVLTLCLVAGVLSPGELEISGYSSYREPLPKALLDKITEGIEFAFRIGSAREIGYLDLSHAHLLYKPGTKFRLSQPDGILLHTQEINEYGPESLKLRNILLTQQGPKVLACELGHYLKNRFGKSSDDFCTVHQADLGLENPSDVMFMVVDGYAAKDLPVPACNIRRILGHKVLFFITPYHPSMYASK